MSAHTRFALYKQALRLLETYKPIKEHAPALTVAQGYLYEHARHVVSEYEASEDGAQELATRGMVPQAEALQIF